MQYGNEGYILEEKAYLGLNRTMQYGNQDMVLLRQNLQILFKSYYVVWKPPSFNFFTIEAFTFKSYYVVWKLPCEEWFDVFDTEFKSYYVVWKPQEQKEGREKKEVFKSYYVVWKRKKITKKPKVFRGLNRTMQYGNLKSGRKHLRNSLV